MDLPSGFVALRWLHVGAGAAWFGEVVTINLVLVPAVLAMSATDQTATLAKLFPRLFRLASFLSATAVAAGLGLLFIRYQGHWGDLIHTGPGRTLLLGATLASALTAFHFVLEPRLDGMICTAADNDDFELTQQVLTALKIVPRVGLGVITGIVILMMIAARGW